MIQNNFVSMYQAQYIYFNSNKFHQSIDNKDIKNSNLIYNTLHRTYNNLLPHLYIALYNKWVNTFHHFPYNPCLYYIKPKSHNIYFKVIYAMINQRNIIIVIYKIRALWLWQPRNMRMEHAQNVWWVSIYELVNDLFVRTKIVFQRFM